MTIPAMFLGPADSTVVAYREMSNGDQVMMARNPIGYVNGGNGIVVDGRSARLLSATHSASTMDVFDVHVFTTDDTVYGTHYVVAPSGYGEEVPYHVWREYAGTMTYNTTSHLFAASISPTLLARTTDYVAWNPAIETYSLTAPYVVHNPLNDLVSQAVTGIDTSLDDLPPGSGCGSGTFPEPVFIGYLLAAGQYRLVAGVLNSSLLSVYVKVPGSTTWLYAGAETVPYPNSAHYSGRYDCVKASSLGNAAGAATGTVVSFSFDGEYYSYHLYEVVSQYRPHETDAPPTVTLTSPINGAQSFDQVAEAIPLAWSYADPDDSTAQLKREVRIAENVSGATVYYLTSGGALTVTETEVTTGSQTTSIPPGTLWASAAGYQWQVRAADIHGVYGEWSSWSSFSVTGRPSATITNPSPNGTVSSNRPIVVWIYDDPELGAESARRLRLYATDGSLLWDSGILAAPVGIAVQTSDNLQVGLTLANFTVYSVGVLVADSDGIWSSEANRTFSTSITYPPAPTIGVTFDASGIATVTVTANSPAANQSVPVSCDLYRWSLRLAKYVLVSAGLAPTFAALDRAGPSNTTYHYKVITAGANGSALDTLSANVSYDDPEWRLLTSSANVVLSIDEMNFETPMSQDTLEPMGRDHPIVVTHGTRGVTGQISASLIASERISVRDAVEALANTTEVVYLRNPFGEVFAVSLGSIAETPVTGGNATLVIPFTEVADA